MFGNNIEKIQKLAEKKKSDKLQKYLKDDNSDVRIAAIKSLGEIGDETSFNSLTLALQSTEPAERMAAAEALGKTGSERTITFLAHKIKSETDEAVIVAFKHAMASVKANMKQ